MVVELLRFKLASKSRDKFIELDHKIWTRFLAKQPGFLGKKTLLNPTNLEEIILIIHWQTHEQWKSISERELADVEEKFTQAMLPDRYNVLFSVQTAM